ncbi:MAG: 2OG-Fe(II) oxygenase [Gammaproteobacteria bacterium]|jgi:alkylated DNA repair dioxygenase AlkB|nr:2OG-Fe(II) oxygenase [Gammaproteobacteria bacterium]
MMSQRSLFSDAQIGPPGFDYQPEFLGEDAASALLLAIAEMPLAEAEYKQYRAHRRVLHFGGRYDYSRNELLSANNPWPDILIPLRDRIAERVGIEPTAFTHAMFAEYRPGTQLGWHRDVPDFEIVAGVSLGAPAVLQFRPYPPVGITRKDVLNAHLEPRSMYVLRDAVRWNWQHRVPPVTALRYSVTFRTLRSPPRP